MTETTKEERLEALDVAIARGGGIIRFAKAMGVTHQAVYNWRKRGWVPADKALVIETIFGIGREYLMEPRLVAVMRAPVAQASDII